MSLGPLDAVTLPQLQGWFSQRATEELERLNHQSISSPMSFWGVGWTFGTAFVRLPVYLLVSASATFASFLCVSRLANRLTVYSGHAVRKISEAFAKVRWGSQLLVPSYNDYRSEDASLFTRDKVARQDLKDAEIKAALHPKIKKIDPAGRIGKGLCHGGVTWFNYLFLLGLEGSDLAKQSKTYREYAEKIASLFAEGAPTEAALIQSFYGVEKKIFQIQEQEIVLPLTAKTVDYLNEGVYYIHTDKHALSFIKVDDIQLLWDKSEGLIEIRSAEDLLSALQPYTDGSALFVHQFLEKQGLFSKICAWLGRR